MKRRKFLMFSLGFLSGCGGSDMSRPILVQRFFNGVPVNGSLVPQRNLATPTSTTGLYKDYVLSTSPLTTTELNVAKAFLILFGRAPDNSGLAYWTSTLGVNATIAQAVDAIIANTASNYLLDPDNGVFIATTYYHILGKTTQEDPGGQAYWVSQISSTTSKGTVVQNIINAIVGLSGYFPDLMRNRFITLESICRIQKSQSFNLSTQDSITCVLRVVGEGISYEEAMGDIYRLLISRIPSTANSWAVSLTAQQLYDRARVVDNSSIRQMRWLVWYDRDANMMLSSIYMPTNFLTVTTHIGIISLHGGGWRQGYPEKLYDYNTAFAGSAQGYVVVAPTYRLTAFNYSTPALENDAVDIRSLVSSSPFLNINSAKIGMFGESSGGHLSVMLGATQNAYRVFALYPPIDLTGSPTSVSTGLNPYVNYFASTPALKATASPTTRWSSGRTTLFYLWHGLSDTFVPPSQTDAFKAVAGTYCYVKKLTGEGHGFSTAGRAAATTAAIAFFDDTQPLPT